MRPTAVSFLLYSCLTSTALSLNYTNAVVPDPADTPDPGVAFDPSTNLFYAATTGGSPTAGCFEVRSSPDLATWTLVGLLFPPSAFPNWIDPSNPDPWAPEMHYVYGQWRVFFVGRHRNGLLSIGVGTSTTGRAAGPYVDSGAPLVQGTGTNPQGQIDPTIVFNASGAAWVVWKTDGNADGLPTPIRAAPLAPSGTALLPFAWESTHLITNDLAWEGPLVEAPWIVQRGGVFFLFYSGNGYGGASYAVGVARSSALLGPFEKKGDPILATAPGAHPVFPGPGHCAVVTTRNNNTAIVYHAHSDATSKRHIMLDELTWVDDGKGGEWPEMASGTPQPGVGPQVVP
jgi:arabinan endo-1,5-alpha-L-arabinosidase